MVEKDELARRRAEKMRDSSKWKPEDALQACIDDIRSGKLNVDSLVICVYERLDDKGSVRPMSYLAQMTYESYVALLAVMQHNAIQEWHE